MILNLNSFSSCFFLFRLFYERLFSIDKKSESCKGIEYWVWSVGDSSYFTYQSVGRSIDSKLSSLGAFRKNSAVEIDERDPESLRLDHFFQSNSEIIRNWFQSSKTTITTKSTSDSGQTSISDEDEDHIQHSSEMRDSLTTTQNLNSQFTNGIVESGVDQRSHQRLQFVSPPPGSLLFNPTSSTLNGFLNAKITQVNSYPSFKQEQRKQKKEEQEQEQEEEFEHPPPEAEMIWVKIECPQQQELLNENQHQPTHSIQAGDHIQILPTNSNQDVDRILARFKISSFSAENELFFKSNSTNSSTSSATSSFSSFEEREIWLESIGDGEFISLKQTLKRLVDLNSFPTQRLIEFIFNNFTSSTSSTKTSSTSKSIQQTRQTLLKLMKESDQVNQQQQQQHQKQQILRTVDFICGDICSQFVDLKLTDVLECLDPIKSRFFSIAKVKHNEQRSSTTFKIAVSLISLRSSPAFCTNFFLRNTFQNVNISIQKSACRLDFLQQQHHQSNNKLITTTTTTTCQFPIECGGKRSILMIGSGVGIFQFIGMLDEIEQAEFRGEYIPTVLLLCSLKSKESFEPILKRKLEKMAAKGIVKYKVSFARDNKMLEELVLEESPKISELLGLCCSRILLCGNQDLMSNVKQVLARIVSHFKRTTNTDPMSEIDEMISCGRFVGESWVDSNYISNLQSPQQRERIDKFQRILADQSLLSNLFPNEKQLQMPDMGILSMLNLLLNPMETLKEGRQKLGHFFGMRVFGSIQETICLLGDAGNEFYSKLTENQVDYITHRMMTPSLRIAGIYEPKDGMLIHTTHKEYVAELSGRCDHLFKLMSEEIESQLIPKLRSQSESSDFYHFIFKTFTRASMRFLFGEELFCEIPEEIYEYYYDMDYALTLQSYVCGQPFFNWRWYRARRRIEQILTPIIDLRRKPQHAGKNGIVDRYFSKRHPEDNSPLSTKEVVWAFNGVLFAMHHYPSIHSFYALLDILERPKVLQNVQSELNGMEKEMGLDLRLDGLKSLEFFQSTLKGKEKELKLKVEK